EYLVVSIASLLSLYYGFHLYNRRHAAAGALAPPPKLIYRAEYNTGKMLAVGTAWAAIGLAVYVLTYHQFRQSGYLRDLAFLRIPAVILLIQALMIDRSVLAIAVFFILLGIAPDVNHARNYGGRGSAAILFDMAMVPFFFLGRRPRKATFLIAFATAGIVLLALAGSRTVLG
ncbi:MAG: hypothetical protein ACP5P4_17150, partial [Steroidobacteraceae bacterium]